MIGRELHATFGQPARGGREGSMLDVENTLGQALRGIARQDGHAALRDDRTVIQHGRDEVHGAAVRPHTGRQGLRMGMQARKRGQQRRMDVDEAARIMPDKARRQHTHEAGEQNVVGLVAVDLGHQRGVEGLAAGEILVIQRPGGNALALGPLQPCRIGTAGDDSHDPRGPLLALTGLDQCLHIAAPTGDQDDNAALTPGGRDRRGRGRRMGQDR